MSEENEQGKNTGENKVRKTLWNRFISVFRSDPNEQAMRDAKAFVAKRQALIKKEKEKNRKGYNGNPEIGSSPETAEEGSVLELTTSVGKGSSNSKSDPSNSCQQNMGEVPTNSAPSSHPRKEKGKEKLTNSDELSLLLDEMNKIEREKDEYVKKAEVLRKEAATLVDEIEKVVKQLEENKAEESEKKALDKKKLNLEEHYHDKMTEMGNIPEQVKEKADQWQKLKQEHDRKCFKAQELKSLEGKAKRQEEATYSEQHKNNSGSSGLEKHYFLKQKEYFFYKEVITNRSRLPFFANSNNYRYTMKGKPLTGDFKKYNIMQMVMEALDSGKFDKQFVIKGSIENIKDTIVAIHTCRSEYKGKIYIQKPGDDKPSSFDFSTVKERLESLLSEYKDIYANLKELKNEKANRPSSSSG